MSGITRRTAVKSGVVALGSIGQGLKSLGQDLPPGQVTASLAIRSRTRFNNSWTFVLGDPTGAEQPSFDNTSWRSLNLPHDWGIELPFAKTNPSGIYGGYSQAGIGWYRKNFTPPVMSDRQCLLVEFEGIYRNSQVWLNGTLLGNRPNGFASVQYDLTPQLIQGQPNVIAVRVDNSVQPNLRWYSGSGIYRHAWLTLSGRVRVDYGGTYITTPVVTVQQAIVQVVTTLRNTDGNDANTRLDTQIIDKRGRMIALLQTYQTVPAGNSLDVKQVFTVQVPDLWSLDTQNLYSLYSVVRQDGLRIDDYTSTFGIRTAVFDANRGLLLNGQSVKLKGLCIHHDLGSIGSAAHDNGIERRLLAMQSIGCNAIRVGHNPPAPYFLDLCDRMGFLVIDEAFDKWDLTYPEGDFGSPGFDDWWQQDVQSMLNRDRNHPCIILWSVGNEAGAPGDPVHDATLKQLADFVRANEPARPVTCALRPQTEGTLDDFANNVAASGSMVDVIAVNYQEQYLDLYRDKMPNKTIVSTESYPFFHGITNGYDTVNNWWTAVTRDFDAGQFVWCGVDYLGETAGWPSKGWPNGLIDSCGYVKARAAFNNVAWHNNPKVIISVVNDSLDLDLGIDIWRWPKSASHWNFRGQEGQTLLVNTTTNCDLVELIVNGASFGQQQSSNFPNGIISWYVPYAAGTVDAIGTNAGQVVSKDRVQTAGAPSKIALRVDKPQIAANSLDITHVEVMLQDSTGILVPDHDLMINFVITGPGKLIAVDNGDLRSAESYQGSFRTTYLGRALAIVQSTGDTGLIVVAAYTIGLSVATAGIAAGSQ